MSDDTGAADTDETEDAAPEPEPIPEARRPGHRLAGPGGAARRPGERYRDLVETCADEGYLDCIDLTAVDYLAHPPTGRWRPGIAPERFEVVVSFLSHEHKARTRLRIQVPEADPTVPSIVDLHPGADALEREVFDMFGITFDGPPRPHPHPDARGLGGPSRSARTTPWAPSRCSSRAPDAEERS